MGEETTPQLLLERWRQGDEAAASALFQLYRTRLCALARHRLHSRLGRRVDPDDVVQSVFRSFFRRSREGHFVVTNSESLWRLLARITVLKVLRTSKRHRAGLRDVIAEAEISDDRVFEMLAREPTAEEAVALTEEVQLLLERASPQKREIITLCLQGFTCSEIVARVGCSRWTVRRVLDDAGKQVQERFRL